MQLRWEIAIWVNPSLKNLFSLYGFVGGGNTTTELKPQLKEPRCICEGWGQWRLFSVFISIPLLQMATFLRHSSPLDSLSVCLDWYQGSLQLVPAVEKKSWLVNRLWVATSYASEDSYFTSLYIYINIDWHITVKNTYIIIDVLCKIESNQDGILKPCWI